MKSLYNTLIYAIVCFSIASAGTISVSPANGSKRYANPGATTHSVFFNIGGTYSGYPYTSIYKFVVKIDNQIVFNSPDYYPTFDYTVSLGQHTIYVEMWEYNIGGGQYMTTTSTTTFTLEESYTIYAKNDFVGGSLYLKNTLYEDVQENGVSTNVGNNLTVNIKGVDNQTASDGLLRKFKQWKTFFGTIYSNIEINPLVTGYETYQANYHKQPTVPTSVQNSSSSGSVALTWATNPESDIALYEIERHIVDNGGWVVIGTTSSTSFTDNDFQVTAPRWATHMAEYRVRAKSNANLYSNYSSIVSVVGISYYGQKTIAGGKKISEYLPTEFTVNQNYPNPFNPTTEISYSLIEPSFVTLTVINSAGQEISKLIKEYQGIGQYSVTWDAANSPSGVYFYKLTAGKHSVQKKMLLIK